VKLHKLGLKLVATKAITCGHFGVHEYMNDEPWGVLEKDDTTANYRWAED